MPQALREQETELNRLRREEEEAGARRDYERAATLRARYLALDQEFSAARDIWLKSSNLDEVVDEEDVAAIVSNWTGVPVNRMLETEREKLVEMEARLHERVIGQHEAIVALSDAIRRARSGLKDPSRPIGSFIFVGPTGVGKTELAKALAEFMFDSEDAMTRVDMSEFQERHTVSRLIGAPPGYVGYDDAGQLTESVRRRPYQVVLFDEIEKAHPDVFNTLLQVLDDGRLTDGQGHTIDFRNTVIIMTSNVGTEHVRQQNIGFARGHDRSAEEEARQRVHEALRQAFRPEFLNRIDEIVVFQSLTANELIQIVGLLVAEVADRLREQGMKLDITTAAEELLVKEGYNPAYGARPLRRTVQRMVETPLSRKLLKGEFKPGDGILVDVVGGELTFSPLINVQPIDRREQGKKQLAESLGE